MSILLRRWTTQFLDLEGGLVEDEPEPGVEEVEELEQVKEREISFCCCVTCLLK